MRRVCVRYTDVVCVFLLSIFLIFSIGCSKSKNNNGSSNQTKSIDDARLIELIDEARATANDLSAIGDIEAQKIADGLLEALANLDRLIFEQRRVNQDPLVLAEIDYIILGLSKAGDYDLQKQIDTIKSQIAQLRADLDTLSADYANFKSAVTSRLDAADQMIRNIESGMANLTSRLDSFIAESNAADAALRAAIDDLNEFTQTEIAAIHVINQELAQQINDQKEALDDLFDSQAAVANLQDKICSSPSAPNQCTAAQVSQMVDGQNPNCGCIPIDAIDCSIMFPSGAQTSAQNQCNVIISVLKNHDEQLRLIQELDAQQNELISGLLDDVESLNDQVGVLAEGFDQVNRAVQLIGNKLDELTLRVLIQELKTERLEGAASINERADLNLAWITRRIADVRKRYCHKNVSKAIDHSDYEAARQNWVYCHERLGLLTTARERTHTAKAFVNGALSANMDTLCNQTISAQNDKKASELNVEELMDPDVFAEVKQKCQHGKAVVLGSFLNAVALLDTIGPDFRTIEYMHTKARIGQLLAFKGKDVTEITNSERREFEDIDPTKTKLMNTIYGAVERSFKYLYVKKVLRTPEQKFPRSADEIPNTSGILHTAFSHSDIKNLNPDNAYMRRLKSLEIRGECNDCGFRVKGRQPGGNYNPLVDRNGKRRYSYPRDAKDHCLIENQHVVLKNNDNGHYYVFNLSYHGIWERLRPHLVRGNQVKIANSGANIAAGNYNTCRYNHVVSRNGMPDARLNGRWMIRVTQPYKRTFPGNRKNCVKFTAVCTPQKDDWIAPNTGVTDLARYLSGYARATVNNRCSSTIPGTSEAKVELSASEKEFLVYYRKGTNVSETNTLVARTQEWSLGSFKANPLGDLYWVTKGIDAQYGNNNQIVNRSNSFYGANGSGLSFIRATKSAIDISVKKQECRNNQ